MEILRSKKSRPPDRKKLILVAAETQFIARGYEHVTLEEIADAVGIVPSALYRHFSGRSEILSEIVKQASEKIHEFFLATDFSDPEKALVEIAQFLLENKSFGVIWGREVKHLPIEQRLLLHPIVREIESEIVIHVHQYRPDLDVLTCELVTASIFAVLLSPSFNHLKISRDRYVALLTKLSLKVLNSVIKLNLKIESDPQDRSRLIPYSRREALLQEAICLFSDRSYASVNIEDIGASLGISGPSCYNHFSSKIQILETAFERGTSHLFLGVTESLRGSGTAEEAIRALIESYVHFGFSHPDLVDVLITEIRNLPEDVRKATVFAQQSYIDEWVHLLCLINKELDLITARAQVQSLLSLVNDIVRTRHLRKAVNSREAVIEICKAVLDV